MALNFTNFLFFFELFQSFCVQNTVCKTICVMVYFTSVSLYGFRPSRDPHRSVFYSSPLLQTPLWYNLKMVHVFWGVIETIPLSERQAYWIAFQRDYSTDASLATGRQWLWLQGLTPGPVGRGGWPLERSHHRSPIWNTIWCKCTDFKRRSMR